MGQAAGAGVDAALELGCVVRRTQQHGRPHWQRIQPDRARDRGPVRVAR